MVGGPIYNLSAAVGAKLGAYTVIQSQLIPVCPTQFRSDSILRQDSIILATRRNRPFIWGDPHRPNLRARRAHRYQYDMEDGTQLGNSSSLHDGQTIPKGKRYDGSPARETRPTNCQIEPRACGGFRRATSTPCCRSHRICHDAVPGAVRLQLVSDDYQPSSALIST